MSLEIYKPPLNRRYWAIKVSNGRHYNKFIDKNYIAISHIDTFSEQFDEKIYPYFIKDSEIKELIGKKDKKSGDLVYCSNTYGQLNTFINEISISDWVITRSQKNIRIGRVTSHARIKPLSLQKKKKKTHILQRKIQWGPELEIATIPKAILISLSAPMSCYSLDKHRDAILHTLYPYFIIENELHLSINITKKDEVRNVYITEIFKYLNELEFVSKYDDHTKIVDLSAKKSFKALRSAYREFLETNESTLTTSANFSSPGEIWAKLIFKEMSKSRNYFRAVMIYTLLFGNSLTGFDGLIDIDTRRLVFQTLIKRIDYKSVTEAKEKLDLKQPNYNTDALESSKHDDTDNIFEI